MSSACGATVNSPRLVSALTKCAPAVTAAHDSRCIGGADSCGGICGGRPIADVVDPHPGFNSPHAVDEQHRARWRDRRSGGDGSPLIRRQFDADVDLGGRFPQVLFELQARAVGRVPPVDGKAHLGTPVPRGGAIRLHISRIDRHAVSREMLDVRLSRWTTNRTGTRSASAATWVTTPTIRSP